MKLAFVILNYGTYQETTECVESIEKFIDLSPDEYNITIVDNGSTDGSGIKLKNNYENKKYIDVLLSDSNLGFARGNNLGIKHVNANYSPEFVAVINSDIELIQEDFYKRVAEEYKKSEFGLLGPMMCLANGRCDDSPWRPITALEVKEKLYRVKKERQGILNNTFYISKAITKVKKVLGLYAWKDETHMHEDYWKEHTDVELQGAFLVFSKKIFEYIEGFDPRTFLYYEEQLLYLAVKKTGLPIVYSPQISVFHKDGRSTGKIKSNTKEKMLFVNQCNIDSLEILLDEIGKEK